MRSPRRAAPCRRSAGRRAESSSSCSPAPSSSSPPLKLLAGAFHRDPGNARLQFGKRDLDRPDRRVALWQHRGSGHDLEQGRSPRVTALELAHPRSTPASRSLHIEPIPVERGAHRQSARIDIVSGATCHERGVRTVAPVGTDRAAISLTQVGCRLSESDTIRLSSTSPPREAETCGSRRHREAREGRQEWVVRDLREHGHDVLNVDARHDGRPPVCPWSPGPD